MTASKTSLRIKVAFTRVLFLRPRFEISIINKVLLSSIDIFFLGFYLVILVQFKSTMSAQTILKSLQDLTAKVDAHDSRLLALEKGQGQGELEDLQGTEDDKKALNDFLEKTQQSQEKLPKADIEPGIKGKSKAPLLTFLVEGNSKHKNFLRLVTECWEANDLQWKYEVLSRYDFKVLASIAYQVCKLCTWTQFKKTVGNKASSQRFELRSGK